MGSTGAAAMNPDKYELLNVCSRCVMMLGMCSWSMAAIQDHRSCLQKKDGNKPRNMLSILG